MTDDYIRASASSVGNDTRREIEPETEHLKKSTLLDDLDDITLDTTEGKTVRDLLKEQFDASAVLDTYDEWSAPLHNQATQPREQADPGDAALIKSAGIARAAYDVDTDRPGLEDLTEFKQTIATDGVTESSTPTHDPAWDAVHRATTTARTQLVKAEQAHDDLGPADSGIPIEYRLAKQMQQTGEAADVSFDHLVEAARQMLNKQANEEKGRNYVSDPAEVPEGANPQQGPRGGTYYDTPDSGTEDTLQEDTLSAIDRLMDQGLSAEEVQDELLSLGKAEYGDNWTAAVMKAFRTKMEKDGRRVYLGDPADAPEGVSVHQGPQGGYYYEPSVQQPNATDDMASPGDGGRGEAVNSSNIEPVADNQDDAFMGDVNPRTGEPIGEDAVRDWAEEYDFDPEFVNRVVEAVTDLLHPEAQTDNDDTAMVHSQH